MKQALIRSTVVIVLLALAVLSGFGIQKLYYAFEEKNYPLAYSEYVDKYSGKYGVPKEVIYAVIKVESNFNYEAKSNKNAKGLMQIIDETFEDVCKWENLDPDDYNITDPETNIMVGTRYLAYLIKKFEIWETAYAGYNAGPGIVSKWLADEKYGKDGHLLSIPYPETESYVKKVAEAREKYTEILQRKGEIK